MKRDGEVTLSGSMTRQTEQDLPLQDQSSHISNTGRMVEEMEIKMRNLLQEVYCLGVALGTHAHLCYYRFTLVRHETSYSTSAVSTTLRRHGDNANYRKSSSDSSSGSCCVALLVSEYLKVTGNVIVNGSMG